MSFYNLSKQFLAILLVGVLLLGSILPVNAQGYMPAISLTAEERSPTYPMLVSINFTHRGQPVGSWSQTTGEFVRAPVMSGACGLEGWEIIISPAGADPGAITSVAVSFDGQRWLPAGPSPTGWTVCFDPASLPRLGVMYTPYVKVEGKFGTRITRILFFKFTSMVNEGKFGVFQVMAQVVHPRYQREFPDLPPEGAFSFYKGVIEPWAVPTNDAEMRQWYEQALREKALQPQPCETPTPVGVQPNCEPTPVCQNPVPAPPRPTFTGLPPLAMRRAADAWQQTASRLPQGMTGLTVVLSRNDGTPLTTIRGRPPVIFARVLYNNGSSIDQVYDFAAVQDNGMRAFTLVLPPGTVVEFRFNPGDPPVRSNPTILGQPNYSHLIVGER